MPVFGGGVGFFVQLFFLHIPRCVFVRFVAVCKFGVEMCTVVSRNNTFHFQIFSTSYYFQFKFFTDFFFFSFFISFFFLCCRYIHIITQKCESYRIKCNNIMVFESNLNILVWVGVVSVIRAFDWLNSYKANLSLVIK